MALPPERINIKRRRGDEPVETLVLERNSKRQFTDFFFQRLRNEQIDLARAELQSKSDKQDTKLRQGIPVVKPTKPGDESNNIANYKSTLQAKTQERDLIKSKALSNSVKDGSLSSSSTEAISNNRRFHLTRDLSSLMKSQSNNKSRKFQPSIRPPLPTFVERSHNSITQENPLTGTPVPVKTLAPDTTKPSTTHVVRDAILDDRNSSKIEVQPFVSPKTHRVRLGRSIRDDPSTWDQESDQLANELAALAMELDPSIQAEQVNHPKRERNGLDLPMDDFVYETYIRVRFDGSSGVSVPQSSTSDVGFLVIDEETDDLWDQYVRDEDDEDEWDEEDEDSNAEENPRNDYPDDEVSSDDEYGRNIYKYRANASSDEEYGDD